MPNLRVPFWLKATFVLHFSYMVLNFLSVATVTSYRFSRLMSLCVLALFHVYVQKAYKIQNWHILMKIQGIIKEMLIVLYSFLLEITCIFHIFNIFMMVVEFFLYSFFFIVGCVFIAWDKVSLQMLVKPIYLRFHDLSC